MDVSPEEDRTFVKKKLLRQHESKFEGFLFDGSTLFTFVNACPDVSIYLCMLLVCAPIIHGVTNSNVALFLLFFSLAFSPSQGRPRELTSVYKQKDQDGNEVSKEYVLTLRFVGTVEPSDYQHLQIFNLVLRMCMDKLQLTLIRRDYFDSNAKVSVLEIEKIVREQYVAILSLEIPYLYHVLLT